jgi:hypothetical protein
MNQVIQINRARIMVVAPDVSFWLKRTYLNVRFEAAISNLTDLTRTLSKVRV